MTTTEIANYNNSDLHRFDSILYHPDSSIKHSHKMTKNTNKMQLIIMQYYIQKQRKINLTYNIYTCINLVISPASLVSWLPSDLTAIRNWYILIEASIAIFLPKK